MHHYGVIMAGGGGTRFWPVSRQKTPKQLLNLTGRDLLINETIDRMNFVIPRSDVFIVTSAIQAPTMIHMTDTRVLPDHILAEPSARNTAACIGYAAMVISRKYEDGVMLITPADHYISDIVGLSRTFQYAIDLAEKQEQLVTIGITPTFPATGYGYIRYEKNESSLEKKVLAFKEKPDIVLAEEYVKSQEYLWNSGMFVWKASTILDKFKEYAPDIYDQLMIIGDAMGTPQEQKVCQEIYPQIRKISIDYAIMEPASAQGELLVIPGDFGWNDVGSWDMMSVLHEEDEQGNVLLGDTIAIDSKGSICYSTGRLIAILGVKDVVVVETKDAVLVCPKSEAQNVKQIVDELTIRQRRDLL
ncbi:MAG: mannose-1-phosphate guanylyltransferase [Clostridia bacterium]|nr:mannose-1-phosphate guanylyltransferase [Clostridia bacterium]